jgi:RND family efflux transporter MFP subunit
MTEQRHSALGVYPIEFDPQEAHTELLKRQQIVRRTKIASLIVLAMLVLGGSRTVLVRMVNAHALEATSVEQSRRYVKTAVAKRGGAGQTVSLPGTLQGFVQSPVAARASGYVKRWAKDIGSKVVKGELLAEIETPEIDQQLVQAQAASEQTAFSLALAKSTLERWEGLRKKDVVSQQDLDERRSAVAQSQANLAAADANVQRLRQLEEFKRVVAPFAGVITRRNVDVGDLIDSSRVLFNLSQTDPLRVYISVPQAYSQLVKAGQEVVVTQAELRGQKFVGQVARTSASVDAVTRTMQVEVALPNREGKLLPGSYVRVVFPLTASQSLVAPTNALMFRADGTMVAVVDAHGLITLRKIAVGRNYGAEFEVLNGISETDNLVLNPPDWMADGQTVVVSPNKERP